MKKEILDQFQGKENVTHIVSDNGAESYLTPSHSFNDEVNAIGACKLNTVETDTKHVLFLFNESNEEVGRYYLGKSLQGKTPEEIVEMIPNLCFFESYNPEIKSWVPCVGVNNNNQLKKVASKAVSFNSIENKTDIEELMCNIDNIILAVNLAYYAMQYKDPARNEYEVNKYKDSISRISLAEEIRKNLIRHKWSYNFGGIKYSRLKNNGIDYREGYVLNLAEYSLRYLFGIVKYRLICKKQSNYIFGGGNDVFTLNYDENKYESYLEEFVQVQEQCATQYKYLFVFDIKDFFSSVNIAKLKDLYFENSFINDEWYRAMFSKLFDNSGTKGLNPCCEVDFFYANLYLRSLDEKINTYSEIKYYRYCDDIRIFANDSSLLDTLTVRISSVLLPFALELNKEKTRLIDTDNEKIELAKACFVWSSRLYFGTNESSILLEGKSLAEIINYDLTTTYIYRLLKDVTCNADDYDENYIVYLNNLYYILKNVHKNATFYRVVLELFFSRGTSEQTIMMFQFILERVIVLLNDETVEPFVKYWTLRTFFCSPKYYYKIYQEEENKWKDQSWYPKPCLFDKIFEILKKYQNDASNELLNMISNFIICNIKPFDNQHVLN